VKTGPCAPAGCGQPRLAGCNGPVLAVEWDPPMYDGGANLVAYRVWVRPFSATDADPSDWAIQVFSETFFWGGISQIPKILQHGIISKGLPESMFPCFFLNLSPFPGDWLEVGHVKHSSGVQRAEIHTEDLDPSIGRGLDTKIMQTHVK